MVRLRGLIVLLGVVLGVASCGIKGPPRPPPPRGPQPPSLPSPDAGTS
ncbi:LPS translocon maturation chaperone LptM [Archangium sp.]